MKGGKKKQRYDRYEYCCSLKSQRLAGSVLCFTAQRCPESFFRRENARGWAVHRSFSSPCHCQHRFGQSGCHSLQTIRPCSFAKQHGLHDCISARLCPPRHDIKLLHNLSFSIDKCTTFSRGILCAMVEVKAKAPGMQIVQMAFVFLRIHHNSTVI